ncbi:hypothetical protein Tco_1302540, partial [Tanacetum coccineum]
EVWKDKVKLDEKIVKEEEEAVKRNKGEALKEKEDPGAFIFLIRLEGKLGREDIKKVDRGITMINHTQAEAMGILINVLCQVGVTTLIAKFLILDILIDRNSPIVVGHGFLRTIGAIVNAPERLFSTFDGFCYQTFRAARSDFMRNAESDSDDEEDYQIKRNKFGAPIYGPKPAPYLNYNDPDERSLAIQTQVNWKPDYKGSYTKEEEATGQWRTEIRLIDPYTQGTNDNEARSSRSKRPRQNETVEDLLLPQIHHEFLLWEGCSRDAKSRLREAGSDEEIFTSVAWIRAFNINEPIYVELCHEFYSTYEFDEVCADDELQTKKIIKFRLGGRAHNLTLTTWYDKIQKNDLWLLSMFDARHQNGYANVAWVIARWMKRKGAETQKESQIFYGQFISKIARKCRVLTEDVVRSLSAPIYCRDLDTITLRDLIDSEGKLIPEDPQPGVPRVGIPRPPRASMQDLYDRMGRMEIRQEAIERMEYRQRLPTTSGYAQPTVFVSVLSAVSASTTIAAAG